MSAKVDKLNGHQMPASDTFTAAYLLAKDIWTRVNGAPPKSFDGKFLDLVKRVHTSLREETRNSLH